MAGMKDHIKKVMNPDESVYCIHPPLPVKFELELNETCNATCVFCTCHSSCLQEKYTYGVMKPEVAKRLLTEAYEKGKASHR